MTFNRCNQRGFLTADKGPCAFDNIDVKMEAGIENISAQKPILLY
jgi:hypothetical protein